MKSAGSALMGIGVAGGENRAVEAARAAISSPLLEASIEGARGILLNITGGSDLGLFEINESAEIISSAADAECNIIFGAVIDGALGDEVRVTVIATGFDQPPEGLPLPTPEAERAPAPRPAPEEPQETPEDKESGPSAPLFGAEEKPQFEVEEDVLDIPSFLKDD